MLARKIKFEDLEGNQMEQTFYFHLSQAELTQWLMTEEGYTLDKKLQQLYEQNNGKKIMQTFEELICLSYGEKDPDGWHFNKSEEMTKRFKNSEAYAALFTELVTDAKKASEFVNGIIPKKLAEEIDRIARENPNGIPDNLKDYVGNNRS